jgi:hypothetical protein
VNRHDPQGLEDIGDGHDNDGSGTVGPDSAADCIDNPESCLAEDSNYGGCSPSVTAFAPNPNCYQYAPIITVQNSKGPNCPPNIANFLSTMIPLANQLATTWKTGANDILALSAYESGWLGPHAQALHSPYGLTKAGGNDLSFSSYQSATDFWSSNDGSYIQGITDITKFAAAIQPHYNTANPAWSTTLVNVYASVLKWRVICGQ